MAESPGARARAGARGGRRATGPLHRAAGWLRSRWRGARPFKLVSGAVLPWANEARAQGQGSEAGDAGREVHRSRVPLEWEAVDTYEPRLASDNAVQSAQYVGLVWPVTKPSSPAIRVYTPELECGYPHVQQWG